MNSGNAEFGHESYSGDGFNLDTWGSGPFVIVADGKSLTFEDSDLFGPSIVGKNGYVKNKQPIERSPFWRAHRIWVRQGRRTNGDLCIWDEPAPSKAMKLTGRSAYLLEHGDEDGKLEVIQFDEEKAKNIMETKNR